MTPVRLAFALTAILIAVAGVRAAEPTLRTLNVYGLTIDGTTKIVVDGDDLGESPRLLLPFPVQQELAPKSTPKQATFTVALGDAIVPGYYQLRIANEHGVSLPAVIAVDRLPQKPLTQAVEQTPVALHGSVTGGAIAEAKFAGKAGQKVLIEIEAQRMGSKLRPVIHLVGQKRLQLTWAWPAGSRSGDCRIETTLPYDGEYSVTVHDVEYAAVAPSHFRLKIGALPAVDQVFPPAVTLGTSRAVELLGTGSWRSDIVAPSQARIQQIPWPKEIAGSGPRPYVVVSNHPELEEQSAKSAKGQDLPAGNVGVSGRLATPFEADVYRIPVTSGTKMRFEVFAERIGSPLDAALIVRNDAGGQLLRMEDGPGTLDPAGEFVVPEKTSHLLLEVADVQGRGSPSGIYRLRIESLAKAGGNDFRLVTPMQRLSLPASGRGVIPVLVDRQGYRGEIVLSAALPAGFRVEGTTIPAEADGTLLDITRDATPVKDPLIAAWTGKAANGIERSVNVSAHPLVQLQPWLAGEIAVAAVSAKLPEFQIDWNSLPADVAIRPGKKLDLPVKVVHGDEKAVVRLSLITSQNAPLVNKQPDPAKALKVEKAIEFAPKTMNGVVTMLVPAGITGSVCDVAIQGELLTPDKKTVLAVNTTPVQRLAVRSPLVVKLEGPVRREVKVGAKSEPLTLSGSIERRDDFKGDVVVALAGLPTGVKGESATVKASETAFTLKIELPPTVTAGELSGLNLSATAAIDPKQPNARVRSQEIGLTLVVSAIEAK